MNKVLFCIASCAAVVLLCTCGGNRGLVGKAKKPNVILVFADQWRANVAGYAGHPDVKTPNIDNLSEESVVFTNAVSTAPVCAPYRATLLTGQYPTTHGVILNDRPLNNDALTMGEIFKENGYRTGYIGKWHLNGHTVGEVPFSARDKPVPLERRQGFVDYWKVREVTHDYNHSFYFDENDTKHYWDGYDVFPQTDSAISFINHSKDSPFLLVLSWGPPHDPYHTAPEEYRARYDPAEIHLPDNVPPHLRDSARHVLANYYAHCTAIDEALGKLVAAVEAAGIADNTIFVFTSDHGDMLLSHGVLGKQRPWDESILVPMLLRYPAMFGRERKMIDKPIGTPDILPTLLGLAGLPVPATIQGVDVSAGIRDTARYPVSSALIMYPVPSHDYTFMKGGREYRGLRTERFTYARRLDGPWLLYDNPKDPFQLNNLIDSASYQLARQELDNELTVFLERIGDKFLPADELMGNWGYIYDMRDSLRPAAYYESIQSLKP